MLIQNNEIEKYNKLKLSVYEDFKDGLLEQSEYESFSKIYSDKLSKAKIALSKLDDELKLIWSDEHNTNTVIEHFKKHKNIEKLERSTIVSLIEKIYIFENNNIEIVFTYSDKYMLLQNCINETMDNIQLPKKEAV